MKKNNEQFPQESNLKTLKCAKNQCQSHRVLCSSWDKECLPKEHQMQVLLIFRVSLCIHLCFDALLQTFLQPGDRKGSAWVLSKGPPQVWVVLYDYPSSRLDTTIKTVEVASSPCPRGCVSEDIEQALLRLSGHSGTCFKTVWLASHYPTCWARTEHDSACLSPPLSLAVLW